MSAPILIGTCNWSDHKQFYPAALSGSRQKEKLSFYAAHFPIVEVDTTFYGIPPPRTAIDWVERTPDEFRFNVKAYRSLTGHERDGKVPRAPTSDEVRDFMAALAPMRSAGKLAAVHYQFPPWFTNTVAARDAVAQARERHPDDIVAVEFRHRSWFDKGAVADTEGLLHELDAVFVGVDAPQVGTGTAPRHLAITSPRLAIVRFHGRNVKTWYRGGPTSADRFDYLYTPRELEQWVPAIRAAADAGVPVHVLMNNNRDNQAVVNAYDMAALLGIRLPRPPDPVIATFVARDGGEPRWLADLGPVRLGGSAEPGPNQELLRLRDWS